jgi:hypothetical protein
MTAVSFAGADITVEAALVAEALSLTEDDLRERMRAGRIVTRCERGEGEDAGRWRLSFVDGHRILRLTVEDSGAILGRSLVDYGDREVPGGVRRL